MTDFQDITDASVKQLPPTGIEEWDRDGVLHLDGIIPHPLIDAYVEERTRLLGGTPKWRPGWNGPTPYLQVASMRELALYRPMTKIMSRLIGGCEPGLHLTLTGFQSTERAWHSDGYLNPAGVDDRYIAAWIALADVHPDSGPFEYAAGSHRWGVIDRAKVWAKMREMGQDPGKPTWPSDSQGWVGEACAQEILRRRCEVRAHLPKKGDVLLWHAHLIHRGSMARSNQLERRALIAHYSSIRHRPDMPNLRFHEGGSHYFDFPENREPDSSTHRSM